MLFRNVDVAHHEDAVGAKSKRLAVVVELETGCFKCAGSGEDGDGNICGVCHGLCTVLTENGHELFSYVERRLREIREARRKYDSQSIRSCDMRF